MVVYIQTISLSVCKKLETRNFAYQHVQITNNDTYFIRKLNHKKRTLIDHLLHKSNF